MTENQNVFNDLSECTILVVDDVEANIDILVETLGDDYDITVAMDGPTALEAIEESLPDLILLDIMMPGMDGYEVCRRLKADEKAKNIPVIFITAKSEVEDETKGFECGAVDYITKPVSPPIVKARVKTHLALRQARTTLEVQNRELIEAALLREDVDKIMRHDLKGPLSSILGFSQLMIMDGNLEDEHLKFVKFIESSGLKMLNMINLSMDLFKMERGTYQLQPASVDLFALARRIGAEVQTLARSKKIDIQVIKLSSEAACAAWAEELLCYSMMVNLLKNAVEASPGNETVNLTLDSDTEPQFAIHNRGAVPPEIRDRFFDKYITAGKTGGTGLGTYSAQLMAETMGGTISMTTSEEEGTTIIVRLRPVLSKSPDRAAGETTQEFSISDSDIEKWPPMRLLVVDDDQHNRGILEKYLALPSISLKTAENGREALKLLKTDTFDFVLMDWEMPVMTGSEAVRNLRAWEKENNVRRIPAAALSGHDSDQFKKQSLIDGFDIHLTKSDVRKILVIDDDKNVGSMLKIKLEKKGGYQVLYADRGAKGIEMAKKESPDLIVLDFNMPGADGGDVKAKLTSGAETRNIPIIFLTSLLTAEEAKAKGDKIGGQPMISKHLDISDIIARIEAALAG